MTTTWFLDVDGVINALHHLSAQHLEEFEDWNIVKVNGYSISYATEVIDFINAMSEKVEIVWLTTWADNAPLMLAPALGLKEFKVASSSTGLVLPFESMNGINSIPANRWWKLNVIMNHIELNGGSFIWTDDQMTSEVRHNTRSIADREGIEYNLTTPAKGTGLNRKDLAGIKNFIDTLEKYGEL